jgi:hypothetical protein
VAAVRGVRQGEAWSLDKMRRWWKRVWIEAVRFGAHFIGWRGSEMRGREASMADGGGASNAFGHWEEEEGTTPID